MSLDLPPNQRKLDQHQLLEFNFDGFVETQFSALKNLIESNRVKFDPDDYILDIGGGYGYFALSAKAMNPNVRVYETDLNALEYCRGSGVEARHVDATMPTVIGDEKLVCFNLILHHLIGKTERETKTLQESAIRAWSRPYIFVHEYCYQSYFSTDLSARLIYVITSSSALSVIGKLISKFIPSLRANTFGVGVRFRSSPEWLRFFEKCGFEVLGVVRGLPEDVSLARRLLLIKSIRRDSYLIKAKQSIAG